MTAVDLAIKENRPKWEAVLVALQIAEEAIVCIDRRWQEAIDDMDVAWGVEDSRLDAFDNEFRERCGYNEAAAIGDRIAEMVIRRLGGRGEADVPDPAR